MLKSHARIRDGHRGCEESWFATLLALPLLGASMSLLQMRSSVEGPIVNEPCSPGSGCWGKALANRCWLVG